MKKIIAAILVLVFALAMSGCVKITYWDGLTKSEARELVENALEEKYGEEFVVKKMYVEAGSWDTASDLRAYCSPKYNEKIVFSTQTLVIGKERPMIDTYIQSIVGKKMRNLIENSLSKHFKNFVAEVEVFENGLESKIQSSAEATIENYTNAFPDNRSCVWIAFDKKEFGNNFDNLNEYIEDFVKDFGLTNCYIDCYFVSPDIINQCREKISSCHYDVGYRITADMEGTLSNQRPTYMYSYYGINRDLQLYKIAE